MAGLRLSIDAQRVAHAAIHQLAHAVAGGRWHLTGEGLRASSAAYWSGPPAASRPTGELEPLPTDGAECRGPKDGGGG